VTRGYFLTAFSSSKSASVPQLHRILRKMVGRDGTLEKLKGEHEQALLKSAEDQLKEVTFV
jgi:hypothetical protein